MRRDQFDRVLELRKEVSTLLGKIDSIIKEDGRPVSKVTMEDVINEVLDYASLDEADFSKHTSGKTNNIAVWRKIACYILLKHTKIRAEEIKRRIGYTSSGSGIVLFHAKDIETWMKEPRYAPKGVYLATKTILTNLGYETT